MKLSVVIPIYNEEKTLSQCIDEVYEKNSGRDMEVILVDDGSTDKTADIAKIIDKPNFSYYIQKKNRGKGAAVRVGIEKAQGDIIIIQDADLEYNPGEYESVITPIEQEKAEVVYGSRILNKKNEKSTWFFYLGGRTVTFWANLLYGSNLTDEPTCYKAFKADILKNLNMQSHGFEIEAEFSVKVLRGKFKFMEIPVIYKARSRKDGKKINGLDAIKGILNIIKFRFLK
jgi:glycosyltransferase involved in cell wall biosynthesis